MFHLSNMQLCLPKLLLFIWGKQRNKRSSFFLLLKKKAYSVTEGKTMKCAAISKKALWCNVICDACSNLCLDLKFQK